MTGEGTELDCRLGFWVVFIYGCMPDHCRVCLCTDVHQIIKFWVVLYLYTDVCQTTVARVSMYTRALLRPVVIAEC